MPIDYRKPAPAPAAPPPAAGAGAPAGAGGPVGLTKVTLTKASPTVSLAKQYGTLHVNLNWNARPAATPAAGAGGGKAKGGFLAKLKEAAAAAQTLDLDLGCLWELTDGSKGVVQSLGNQFGSWESAPYILLDGDDRSGAVSGGENLDVNLAHATELKRVLVFASIYQGAKGFGEAGGIVTLSPGQGPDVVVHLDADGGTSRMCAVALLEFERGVVTVRREVNYVTGAQDVLDREYGWGMNWRAGRK